MADAALWREKLDEIKTRQRSVKEFVSKLLSEIRKINAQVNDDEEKKKQDRVFKEWLKRVSGDDEDESGRKIEAQFTQADQEEAARHFMAARKRAVKAEEHLSYLRSLFHDQKMMKAATGKADINQEDIYGCIYANPHSSAARSGATGGAGAGDQIYANPHEQIYANPGAESADDGGNYNTPGVFHVGGGGAIYSALGEAIYGNANNDIYGTGGDDIYGNRSGGDQVYGSSVGRDEPENIYGNQNGGEQLYGVNPNTRGRGQQDGSNYGNPSGQVDGIYGHGQGGQGYEGDEYGNAGGRGGAVYGHGNMAPRGDDAEYAASGDHSYGNAARSTSQAEYGALGDRGAVYGNAEGQAYGAVSPRTGRKAGDPSGGEYGNLGRRGPGQDGSDGNYGNTGRRAGGNRGGGGAGDNYGNGQGGRGDQDEQAEYAGAGMYNNRAAGGGEYAPPGQSYGNGAGAGGRGQRGGDSYGNAGGRGGHYQASAVDRGGEDIYAAVQQKIGDSIEDVRSDYAEGAQRLNPAEDGFGVAGRRLKTVSVYTKERRRRDVTELSGWLVKQSENKRGWKRRWFVMDEGNIVYYKDKSDVGVREPEGGVPLFGVTRVMKTDIPKMVHTFEIITPKRAFILGAESADECKNWIKSIQNVMKRATGDEFLVADAEGVAISGWLEKAKAGRTKRRFFVLLSRVLYYYRTPKDKLPLGEIYLMDTNIEDVPEDDSSEEDASDTEVDHTQPNEHDDGFYCFGLKTRYSTYYMRADSSEQKEKWMFFIVQTGTGSQLYLRTETERIIAALANRGNRIDDPLCDRPVVSFNTDQAITDPLTTLPTKGMEEKAMNVLDKILQFAGVPFDKNEPEFHCRLAQDLIRICLKERGIAGEIYCQLIKLTNGHSEPDSPLALQCWQILALCCGIFLPGKHIREYLDLHLRRYAKNDSMEHGKYALYCQRVVKKQLKSGQRQYAPSRVEVLAVCSQNPLDNALSMCVPVYLFDGTMIEVRFDPGTTCKELVQQVNQQLHLYDASVTGMALYLGLLRKEEGSGEKDKLPSRRDSVIGRKTVIDTIVKEVSMFGTQDEELAAKQQAKKQPVSREDKRRLKMASKYDQIRGTSESLKIRQMLEKRFVDPNHEVNGDRREQNGKAWRKGSEVKSMKSAATGVTQASVATMNSINSYTSGRSMSGNRRQAGLASRKAVADSMKGKATSETDQLLIDTERHVNRPKLESEGRSLLDNDNMCDILSDWEGFSKNHIQRLVLTFKRRTFYRRKNALDSLTNELEKKLIFHQLNEEVVNGRYPLDEEIMVTFAALQAQVQFGREKSEKHRWLFMPDVLETFVNPMFITAGTAKMVMDKWEDLADFSKEDCIQRYLAIYAEWGFHGSSLFYAETEQANPFDPIEPLWLAVNEEGLSILGYEDLTAYVTYKYQRLMSFANTADDVIFTVRVPKDVKEGEPEEEITEKIAFRCVQAAEVVFLVRLYINSMVAESEVTCDYVAAP